MLGDAYLTLINSGEEPMKLITLVAANAAIALTFGANPLSAQSLATGSAGNGSGAEIDSSAAEINDPGSTRQGKPGSQIGNRQYPDGDSQQRMDESARGQLKSGELDHQAGGALGNREDDDGVYDRQESPAAADLYDNH